MIVEKMLELQILTELLKTQSQCHKIMNDHLGCYDEMVARYEVLKDEFINQYKLPAYNTTNPVTDIKQ